MMHTVFLAKHFIGGTACYSRVTCFLAVA